MFLKLFRKKHNSTSLQNQDTIDKFQFKLDHKTILIQKEIQHYVAKLKEYQIELTELPDISPKRTDERNEAKKIAKLIAENKQLRDLFLQNKTLPLGEILSFTQMNRIAVQHQRNYIVALVLLFLGNYEYIQ